MTLPDFLVDRYKEWKENTFQNDQDLFQLLVKEGQKPKALVISCCDSRVHANQIFKSKIGDLFIHRNIANLIPSLDSKLEVGTISSIEYGICELKIPNIIILGHSNCGGIKHAFQRFKENSLDKNSYVDNWIKIIQPAYQKINIKDNSDHSIKSLEKLSIVNSISNLLNYQFVNNLVRKNKLKIHGVWFDMKSGSLMIYNNKNQQFKKLTY